MQSLQSANINIKSMSMQLTIIIYAIREYGIKLSHQWFKIHSKGLEIENTVSDMSMSHHTTVYYYLRELTWSTTVMRSTETLSPSSKISTV